MHWEDFTSAFLILFFVMDPIGNIPLFLIVLEKIPIKKRKWIIAREVLFAMLILILFLYFGNEILHYLGISQFSLKISGSIILFLISIRMIFPPTSQKGSYIFGELPRGEPFLFPLAMPSLAGPSAIMTVILLSNQNPEKTWIWLFAILFSCFFALMILLSSNWIAKYAGEKGIFALEKLMGMILTAISIEMFLKGIQEFLITSIESKL
ncbi:MAG: MarC family protein [Leptospiraceae bacterium]|nr:MarC family protein [Leptospiraceae bacterium]MDW7975040.1 MarC family protein [Leptospiraceae bacterium]